MQTLVSARIQHKRTSVTFARYFTNGRSLKYRSKNFFKCTFSNSPRKCFRAQFIVEKKMQNTFMIFGNTICFEFTINFEVQLTTWELFATAHFVLKHAPLDEIAAYITISETVTLITINDLRNESKYLLISAENYAKHCNESLLYVVPTVGTEERSRYEIFVVAPRYRFRPIEH